MSDTYTLDRRLRELRDDRGRVFDLARRQWQATNATAAMGGESAAMIDAIAAVAWLQKESGRPLRVPIGVIGPREATPAQLATGQEVGRGLARMGLTVVCGGRGGVMHAVCEGVSRGGGLSIGLLPETSPDTANPFVGMALATGIGEARNALIARVSLCLIAIGDSFGTLSEVALGRQFGKTVIGIEGAAQVDGVLHVASVPDALRLVARVVLVLDAPAAGAGNDFRPGRDPAA